MVPYNDKKRGKVAQFQIGYKGYIQLAERSGQYLDLDAFPVVEGEYKGRDRFTRRPILEFLEDDGERENRPVVGYYAYFELTNGFRKVLYLSLIHIFRNFSARFRSLIQNLYLEVYRPPSDSLDMLSRLSSIVKRFLRLFSVFENATVKPEGGNPLSGFIFYRERGCP